MNSIDHEATRPTFDFSAALREARLSGRQAFMLLTLGLLVLIDGMDTQMLSVIARSMTHDLDLPISTFGILFSTGLLGGVVGALLMSPVADRLLGPKTVAVFAMVLAGVATFLTPTVGSFHALLAVRFVAGLGLGSATPSIFALAAEYAPKNVFRPVTSVLMAFMPLGSFLGGMLGLAVVPAYGWQMLPYVGGVLTLLLALAAALILPESVHFLLLVKADQKPAALSAGRIFPGSRGCRIVVDDLDDKVAHKQPFARLFSPTLWRFTTLLWISNILSQGILYFVLSWTPALIEKSGTTGAAGMNAAAMFGIGGALGTAAQGWLTKQFNIYRVMLLEMALYVAAVLAIPSALSDAVLSCAIVFLMSAAICAYQTGFVLILMEAYPSDVRSTGFGWSYGIGRIGATSAPAITGALVGAGWSPGQIFVGAALPGVVSAAALVGIGTLLRLREREAPVPLARTAGTTAGSAR